MQVGFLLCPYKGWLKKKESIHGVRQMKNEFMKKARFPYLVKGVKALSKLKNYFNLLNI